MSEKEKDGKKNMFNAIRFMKALQLAKHDHDPVEVTPGVFLGSIGAAMTKSVLQNIGITHILTVADEVAPMHPEDFEYHLVKILDLEETNLLAALPSALSYIEQTLAAGGKVLVHCFPGRSRSASVCLAWLMKTQGRTLEEGLEYLKSSRPQVQPNDGFMSQLQEYESSIRSSDS